LPDCGSQDVRQLDNNFECVIKVMTLTNLPNVKYIGYRSRPFHAEKYLELPNLDKLTIINCSHVKEIHLKAFQLKSLQIENMPKLKSLQTNSRSLENVHLKRNTSLPPINECYKIMDNEHAHLLNVFH